MSTPWHSWNGTACGMSWPSCAASPSGASLLWDSRSFSTTALPSIDLLGLALEFRAILESGSTVPGFDFPDIAEVTPRLGKEGLQLDGEELAAIGRWILSGSQDEAPGSPGPARRAPWRGTRKPLRTLRTLSRRIFRIVDQDGALREKQIPELAAIRERIRRFTGRMRTAPFAESSTSTPRADTGRPPRPTQRDGRVVLPLKAQYKGRVKGIVHEMSSSGSTVFIEPLEIVEKNNAIVQEENLYRLEVRRILRELTAEVSRHAGEVRRLVGTVSQMDTWMARARYAVSHCCRRAEHDPDTGLARSTRGTRSWAALSCPSPSSSAATSGCSSSPAPTPAGRRSA